MSNGLTPVIVFTPPSSQGQDILWTALSNIKSPNVGYNFVPTNNDMVASHYVNTGGGYSYSPPAPPAAQPNVFGFINAVMSDSTINQQAQMGLAAWYPQLQMFVYQPAILDQGWQALIATYSSSWLTPAVQNSVETYAVQYNIPLVP